MTFQSIICWFDLPAKRDRRQLLDFGSPNPIFLVEVTIVCQKTHRPEFMCGVFIILLGLFIVQVIVQSVQVICENQTRCCELRWLISQIVSLSLHEFAAVMSCRVDSTGNDIRLFAIEPIEALISLQEGDR